MVVRVAVKSRLGTDVEKLVTVKEIEIEETAQKFYIREFSGRLTGQTLSIQLVYRPSQVQ